MDKDTPVWKKRESESKIHWPLRDFRKRWTSSRYTRTKRFHFQREPKAILDREIRQLRNKQVPLVKVLWQHHGMEEATWEPESTMRVQYPHLFNSGNFEDEIYFKEEESHNTLKYTIVVFNVFRVFCRHNLKFS